MVSQRDHHINGHRVNVELALPLINDSLYEQDIVVPNETWMEKVQRKLQFAIPDQVHPFNYCCSAGQTSNGNSISLCNYSLCN